MGKTSKKFAKQQLKHKTDEIKRNNEDAKQKLDRQMTDEAYDEALGTVAELVQHSCTEPEIMYKAALCYFMTGDYKRAADWINNTLTYAPDHLEARVLLARLCILEDRTEDGLAIFDFVLDRWHMLLSDAMQGDIAEILEYYGRNEADKLRQHYPHIAAFLHLDSSEIQSVQQEQPRNSVEVEENGAVETEDDPLARAQSAILRMQQLMENHKIPEEQTASVETAVPKMQAVYDGIEAAEAKTQNEAEDIYTSDAVQTARQDILEKKVSLAEKIKLLNSFAGAYYFKNQFFEAKIFLDTALELDAFDAATLRNQAYLAAEQGEVEEALQYASKMPVMDFALLNRLRED